MYDKNFTILRLAHDVIYSFRVIGRHDAILVELIFYFLISIMDDNFKVSGSIRPEIKNVYTLWLCYKNQLKWRRLQTTYKAMIELIYSRRGVKKWLITCYHIDVFLYRRLTFVNICTF